MGIASGAVARPARAPEIVVNDVHSQLNETRAAEVVRPRSVDDIRAALRHAALVERPVAVAGGRHSMGGQQFATGGTLVDMGGMSRVLDLDSAQGLVDVEAGTQWPQLISELQRRRSDRTQTWTIRQKQTGADRLSIGGAVASNIHGRGLTMPPFVGDVEEITVLTADGELRTCSRTVEPGLFRLVVGGYGLFGIVTRIRLRLAPRLKLRRVVEVIEVEQLPAAFSGRIADGFLYGDFQFAIDPTSADFLRRGVFSCYVPVSDDVPVPDGQLELNGDAWRRLLYLAHTSKSEAFEQYAGYYLRTDGQTYWSDLHQLTTYIDDYHRELDSSIGAFCRGTEMITELYVPRSSLVEFMQSAAAILRTARAGCIYGTIRLIEVDNETFLPWARSRAACVIFNLHTEHSARGIGHSAAVFRALIDCAIEFGGSYFLTYHRFARRDQVLRCYPEFPGFLDRKRDYDPGELLRSDWYAHYAQMFARSPAATRV